MCTGCAIDCSATPSPTGIAAATAAATVPLINLRQSIEHIVREASPIVFLLFWFRHRARIASYANLVEDPRTPIVAVTLTRKFGPTETRRMSMASTSLLQLLTHEFRNHLSVHTFSISPLHDVVRNFHSKLHVESLTDAVVSKLFEIRDWRVVTGLRDYTPAFPLTFAEFHVRSGSTFLVFAQSF